MVLPYIRKDGQRNPEIYDYDRYKLDDFIKNIVALGWGYYYSDDEKYAQKAIQNLRMWCIDEKTKMNPNLNYGQMVPGFDDGYGRAEGIIDIYDMVGMIPALEIITQSGLMLENDISEIKKWYSDLIEWFLSSELGIEERNTLNNHAVAYDSIVSSFSIFTGDTTVYTTFMKNFASKRIFTQIEPNGEQPLELERTTALHYSVYNLDHMLDISLRSQKQGIDIYSQESEEGRSITSALNFLKQYLGKPQDEFPYQQTSDWSGAQDDLAWLLKKASLIEKNYAYEEAFDQYCQTANTDKRWLSIGI